MNALVQRNTESGAPTTTDAELLERFNRDRDETAFRALVDRYAALVFGVAMRRTGSFTLAEEVSQNVFIILARKAHRLDPRPTLSSWLYRCATIESAELVRRQCAYDRKMAVFAEQVQPSSDGGAQDELCSAVYDAMQNLRKPDRTVLLLRFFEGMSIKEIALTLGKSEGAAQKQSERALERLTRVLGRKGLANSSVIVAAQLTTHAAQAMPTALPSVICKAAIVGASSLSLKAAILESLKIMSKIKSITPVIMATAIAVPLFLQWQQNHHLHERLLSLEQQLARTAAPNREAQGSVYPNDLGTSTNAGSVPPVPTAINPIDLWEKAVFERDPVLRMAKLVPLLAELTPASARNVSQVFDKARKAGLKLDDATGLFLRAWGKLAGPEAVEYAQHLPQGASDVSAALAGWSSVKPSDARAWLENLKDQSYHSELVCGLVQGWCLVDFEAAAKYAQALPNTSWDPQIRELLLQQSLLAGGIQAAQNWFEAIPDEPTLSGYRWNVFKDVAEAMALQDPKAAADWISENDGSPFVSSSAVEAVAQQFVKISPADALSWAGNLTGLDDRQRSALFGNLIGSWAQQDPAQAGTWLNQNQQVVGYDNMAAAYAKTVASSDAQTAVGWAQTIEDSSLRSDTVLSLGSAILQQGGDNGVAELQAAGFSDDMIQQAKAWSPNQQQAVALAELQAMKADAERRSLH